MLARTLSDVCEGQGDFAAAASWAEKALAGMQGVVGVKVHPLLKAFFDAVADLKTKAGAYEGVGGSTAAACTRGGAARGRARVPRRTSCCGAAQGLAHTGWLVPLVPRGGWLQEGHGALND
jgi:hypothetical protein